MAKAKKQPAEHWQPLVETFFQFVEEKFGDRPSFDGSAPRDFGAIISALKCRAEGKGLEWTVEVAVARLKSFLEHAYRDSWMREHFMLHILNRQKDKIFFSIQGRGSVSVASFNTGITGGSIYDRDK